MVALSSGESRCGFHMVTLASCNDSSTKFQSGTKTLANARKTRLMLDLPQRSFFEGTIISTNSLNSSPYDDDQPLCDASLKHSLLYRVYPSTANFTLLPNAVERSRFKAVRGQLHLLVAFPESADFLPWLTIASGWFSQEPSSTNPN